MPQNPRQSSDPEIDRVLSGYVKKKVREEATRQGVPEDFADRMASAESAYKPDVIKGQRKSRVGAQGPMQLMPGTARDLKVDPDHINQNIEGGVRYAKQQLDAFGGDQRKASAAYNWGPGNVRKFGTDRAPAETRAYMDKVGGNGSPSADPEIEALLQAYQARKTTPQPQRNASPGVFKQRPQAPNAGRKLAENLLDFRSGQNAPMAQAARLDAAIAPEVKQQRETRDARMRKSREEYDRKSFLGRRASDVASGLENIGQSGQRAFENALTFSGVRDVLEMNDTAKNALAEGKAAQQYTAQKMQEEQAARNAMASQVTRGLTQGAGGAAIMAPLAMTGGVPALMAGTGLQQDWENDPKGALLNTATAGVPVLAGKAIAPIAGRAAMAMPRGLQKATQLGIEGAAGGAANAAQYAGTQAVLGREINPEEALVQGVTGAALSGAMAPKLGQVRRQIGAQNVRAERPTPLNALPERPVVPTTQGPTARVRVTPGDFQRANLETQKGFTQPLTEPLAPTPQVVPAAPVTPDAAPAVAGMPNRADFEPGFLGDVEYQGALANAQRVAKPAKAAAAKPAYDPAAFRGAIDDAKIQAGEAEAAGNWESARDQYKSAMDTITEMQKEARRNRDAAALSELAREKSATNTNWQVAKRNAERAAKMPAPKAPEAARQMPQVQQAQQIASGAKSSLGNAEKPLSQVNLQETAPTRDLSAPLPTPADIVPRTTAEIPRVQPKISKPDSKFSNPPESQNFKNQNEILTPQTNRITEGAGDELPRRVSRPLEGQPAEVPTRFTEYEGGEMQRYSKPLEGQPVEVPDSLAQQADAVIRAAGDRMRAADPALRGLRPMEEDWMTSEEKEVIHRHRMSGNFGEEQAAARQRVAERRAARLAEKAPAKPQYSPEEAALRERESLPPIERRRALRDAVPRGQFGKLSEAAHFGAPRNESLAGNAQLRRLLDLPEMPPYRLPDAPINPKTGEPYTNPAWAEAAQDTLNALAAVAGKERSSQINFGQGDKGSRGEMGDVFVAVRKLAQKKGEPIEPALRDAFKGTVENARTAQEGYQGFMVDERIDNIRNSLDELRRDGKLSRAELQTHKAAWREVAAEYGISGSQADKLFDGTKAEAAARAERRRAAQPTDANQGEGESGSRRMVGTTEQRATGTDNRSAEGGGRAAVSSAKPRSAARDGDAVGAEGKPPQPPVQYKAGDRVDIAGATFEVVKANDDGSVTLKNEIGDQWDEVPSGSLWRKLPPSSPQRIAPQSDHLTRRDDYIKARQSETLASARQKLRILEAKISDVLRDLKITLPVGISPRQYLAVHVNERGRPKKELSSLYRDIVRAEEEVARAQQDFDNEKAVIGTTRYTHSEVHKRRVEKAVAEGKTVPSEVLADYPDLQPKRATNETQPQAPDVARNLAADQTSGSAKAEAKPAAEPQYEPPPGVPAKYKPVKSPLVPGKYVLADASGSRFGEAKTFEEIAEAANKSNRRLLDADVSRIEGTIEELTQKYQAAEKKLNAAPQARKAKIRKEMDAIMESQRELAPRLAELRSGKAQAVHYEALQAETDPLRRQALEAKIAQIQGKGNWQETSDKAYRAAVEQITAEAKKAGLPDDEARSVAADVAIRLTNAPASKYEGDWKANLESKVETFNEKAQKAQKATEAKAKAEADAKKKADDEAKASQVSAPRSLSSIEYGVEFKPKGSREKVSKISVDGKDYWLERDDRSNAHYRLYDSANPGTRKKVADFATDDLIAARYAAENFFNRGGQKDAPTPKVIEATGKTLESLEAKAAKEKPKAATGFTKTQASWIGDQLAQNLPTLDQPGTRLTFKVPGDGQFTVETPRQASRLYKKVTGDYLEGAPHPKFKDDADKPQFVKDAEARLQPFKEGKQVGGGQQLLDQAIVSGYKVYRAGMDFAQWSAEVVKEAGETVKPHLARAWRQIRRLKTGEQLLETNKLLAKESDSTLEKTYNRLKDVEQEIADWEEEIGAGNYSRARIASQLKDLRRERARLNRVVNRLDDNSFNLNSRIREIDGKVADWRAKMPSPVKDFIADEGGEASLGLGFDKILDNLRAGRRPQKPKEIPADFDAQAWVRKSAENLAKQGLSDADKAKIADPNTTAAEKAKIYAAAKPDPARETAFRTTMGEAFAALSANDYNGFQDAANRLKAISDAPATNWEKATAIRKAAMLSRPVSHLRNLIGNTAFQNLEEVARIPGSMGDAMLGAVTGRRTLQGASVEDSARAIYEAATGGITSAKDAMAGRSNEEIAKALQTREVNFNNKVVDKAVKFVFRSLGAEDQIFYTGAYDRAIREAAKLTARNEARQGVINRADIKKRQDALLAAPTPAMEVDATLAAETAVFRNSNKLSEGIAGFRDKIGDKGNFALDLVLPFDKTPTNVVFRALEYSPLGVARGAVKGVAGAARAIGARRTANKNGAPSKADVQAAIDKAFTPAQQRSAAQLLGRGTVGTGLLALGYALASKGMMTGFYDDEDYKGEAMKRATGAQPLAIKIKDRWYGLQGIGPIGMALGMGATMQQEANKKGGDIYGGAAKAAKEQVLETPLLSSMKDLSKDVERVSKDRANAGKLVGNLASSFVPGVLTDIEPFVSPLAPDQFEREVKDDPKKVKGMRRALREGGGQVAAKIPGVRRLLPVKRDITGKPVPSRPLQAIDPFNSRPATGRLPVKRR